jgi:hypothetical protein
VLVSERGAPLSAPGFSRMVERPAIAADLGIRLTPTCRGAPVATSWRMTVTARERSRRISVTATLKIPPAIPPWRRSASRNFFEIDPANLYVTKRAPGPIGPAFFLPSRLSRSRVFSARQVPGLNRPAGTGGARTDAAPQGMVKRPATCFSPQHIFGETPCARARSGH